MAKILFSLILYIVPLCTIAQDSCGFPVNRFYVGIGASSIATLLNSLPNKFNTFYINPILRVKQNNFLNYNVDFGYFHDKNTYSTPNPRNLTIIFCKFNPTITISRGEHYMVELGPAFTYHNYFLKQNIELLDNLGQSVLQHDEKNLTTFGIGADIGVLIKVQRLMFRGGLQIGNIVEDQFPLTKNQLPGYGLLINNSGAFITMDLSVYFNLFYKKKCKA